MTGRIDNSLHVQRLVFVCLVLLPLVERSLEHEPADVVGPKEPHNLFLHVLTLKLGQHLGLWDWLHRRRLDD